MSSCRPRLSVYDIEIATSMFRSTCDMHYDAELSCTSAKGELLVDGSWQPFSKVSMLIDRNGNVRYF